MKAKLFTERNLHDHHPLNLIRYPQSVESRFDERGAPRDISNRSIIEALVYRSMHSSQPGSLVDHYFKLYGMEVSGSNLSERRRGMDEAVFDEILSTTLKPLAEPGRDVDSFYQGMRLLGIDGSSFSLRNAPDLQMHLERHNCGGKGLSGFFKVQFSALVELGTHCPIALECDVLEQECESNLSYRLYKKIPDNSLLCLDQLYGRKRTLYEIHQFLKDKDNAHFLVRWDERQNYEICEELADGSTLIKFCVRKNSSPNPNQIVGELQLRMFEYEVRVNGKNEKFVLVTDLLDEQLYPMHELKNLFRRRWEQEMYYYELKVILAKNRPLKDKTIQTVYQEIVALTLASFITASKRLEVTGRDKAPAQPLRISYRKTIDIVCQFWTVIEMSREVLDDPLIEQLIEKMNQSIARCIIPPRRKRSCPRVAHNPKAGKWGKPKINDDNLPSF